MGNNPDKINFIVSLGSLATNNIKNKQTFKDSIAIGFYNQISIYGVEDSQSLTLLKEICIQDIEEDLVCASYSKDTNLVAFAGALGVGYIYQLSGGTNPTQVPQMVMIDLDEDDNKPEAGTVQGLVRLNGHFK